MKTWLLVSTLRARFSQPTAYQRQASDQNTARVSHAVYLAPAADVRHGDEIRRGGDVFDVVAVFEPSVPGTYLRADCIARQPNTGGP